MTKQAAKRMALDFIGDCVGAQQADGYQSHEGGDWYEAEASIESHTDYSMTVRIGQYLVTLKPTSVSVLPATPLEKT